MPPENDDKHRPHDTGDNDNAGQGDGDWDPRKPEYVVTLRRWKRRVRAVASIGLALAAGTFLAAYARADSSLPETKKPKAPDSRKDAGAKQQDKGDKGKGDKEKDRDKNRDKDKKDKDKGKVDKDEHRKGMPVRDNLLE